MAMHWWRWAAAKGCSDSQVCLGYAFKTGSYGVPPDFMKAHTWFNKRAAKRSCTGKLFLGCCYELGIGVTKDSQKAQELLTKAADSSSRAGKLMRKLNEGQRIEWPEEIYSGDEEGSDI